MNSLVSLLHYMKGSIVYAIKQAKYLLKQLYCNTASEADNTVLNKLFCNIFSKIGDWQGVRCFAPKSMTDIKTLIPSDFPAIEASKHSIALPRAFYTSKNFVAYTSASCTVCIA